MTAPDAHSPRSPLRRALDLLRYVLLVHGRYRFGATRRYADVLKTIRERRCRTLLEVGVFRGARAAQMIRTAALARPPSDVTYYGFDLFEDLTGEDLEREFSKLPLPRAEVAARLGRTGARVELWKGYSQETIPRFVAGRGPEAPEIDLIFLDGGHSVETVAEDWRNLEPLLGRETVVLLDDYYPPGPAELEGVGCRALVEGLDRGRYAVEILETEDRFAKAWGELAIRLVRVRPRGV